MSTLKNKISTWIFDLDNTLYSADSGIFQQVNDLMGKFVSKHLNVEIKKANEEIYLACVGDIHFGSKLFMKKEFTKLISWFRGEQGTEEQKRLAEKTKYVVCNS